MEAPSSSAAAAMTPVKRPSLADYDHAVDYHQGRDRDGSEEHVQHPHQQQTQQHPHVVPSSLAAKSSVSSGSPPPHHAHRSSPTAASVDSFSSYINKDAPLFQNRSSSPRLEDSQRQHSDPASQRGSPQPRRLITTPIVPREAFRKHWVEQQNGDSADREQNGLGSIRPPQLSGTAMTSPGQLRSHSVDTTDLSLGAARLAARGSGSPTPAVDVTRLSSANLARHEDADLSTESPGFLRQQRRDSATVAADDSFETGTSVMGDDSKTEIRRRRRTRPDEANILAEAYLENAFPDHETRLALANQVGMSVRAVSVWFQNRRQAEKKRSGRYGGSGLASAKPNIEGTPLAANVAESAVVTPADESAEASAQQPPQHLPPSTPSSGQKRPLGASAEKNGVCVALRVEQPVEDFSNNNKENIPPWLVGRSISASLQERLGKLKTGATTVGASITATPAVETSAPPALPRSQSRDLRQLVGPSGAGLESQQKDCSAQSVGAEQAPCGAVSVGKPAALSRHRSTPRLSLDEVLSGRSNSLRRATTERASALPARSSDIEEDELDTILPTRNILSRASSSSNLSLLTTAGGRASIGSLLSSQQEQQSPVAAPVPVDSAGGLNSRLPAGLTAVLQKQGIIGATEQRQHGEREVQMATQKRSVLLERMPSSSAPSSDFDPAQMGDGGRDRLEADEEEDEERTLKMIAQRRAARAHARAMAVGNAQAEVRVASFGSSSAADATSGAAMATPARGPALEAREALSQARSASAVFNAGLGRSTSSSSIVIGLGPTPSLDWAAGRDRARTAALPHSVAGTPFSRSVSASQLSNGSRASSVTQTPSSTATGAAGKDGAVRSMPTGGKRASLSVSRSVSAMDLTRRLQEAKQKGRPPLGRSQSRKRPAKAAPSAANDENAAPAAPVAGDRVVSGPASFGGSALQRESPKRRRHRYSLDTEARSSEVTGSMTAPLPAPLPSASAAAAATGLMSAPRTAASAASGMSETSPLLSSRPFLSHNSFPSTTSSSRMGMGVGMGGLGIAGIGGGVPSTPKTGSFYGATGGSSGAMPLSTRSERFRAIAASPAAPLARSISANFHSGSANHSHLATTVLGRESSAREDQHAHAAAGGARSAWGDAIIGPGTAGRSLSLSQDSVAAGESSGWTPRLRRESHNPTASHPSSSASFSLPASTPSRVLRDQTNLAGTPGHGFHSIHHAGTASITSGSPRFLHDDSGFFSNFSEDEDSHHGAGKTPQMTKFFDSSSFSASSSTKKKTASTASPKKTSLRSSSASMPLSMASTKKSRRSTAVTGFEKSRPFSPHKDDQQAAELLLGLGKSTTSSTANSREGSGSSQ
ncbi:hypothetical protein BCV70DRAFT_196994 [Testicularia cyperi]|uniref:Homeobox domain-containing protein n=1 Tax=Testicularia cyperi TaxID=1882483 RepID=A0A317XWW1_9BASI|nr:hypothetical protein BCV70DRAFT_196994 [Testicularia cyperi]